MHLSVKQRQSGKEMGLVVAKGGRGGGRMNWVSGIRRGSKLFHMEQMNTGVWHRELYSISCEKL